MTLKDALTLFGLTSESDPETVKKKYHKLAREFHPDLGGSSDKMRELNDAYKVLYKYTTSREASKMYRKQSPEYSARSFFITKDPQNFKI
jgi:DnaJ-class molecular chaperone